MNCKNCKYYEASSTVKVGANGAYLERIACGVCLMSKTTIKSFYMGLKTEYHEPTDIKGYKSVIQGEGIRVGENFGCIHFENKK